MPLLEARGLSRSLGEDKPVFSGISFAVEAGDILFIRGPSGAGKTLLLRSVALLDPLEGGSLRLKGQSPAELGGIPFWRADVCYVHQARVDFPGTPTEFFDAVKGLCARRGRACSDLPPLVTALGLDPSVVLHQTWASLSGGQAQRISLAIAVALRPSILLLDEPTSALDADAARRAEALLTGCGAALLWVTHDDGQPGRVGRGRRLELPSGEVAPVVGEGAAAMGGNGAAAEQQRAPPPAVEVAIGP